MSRAFFFAHYTAWALIWGHVLVYYSLFAYREWRATGGTWRRVPFEIGTLLNFTFVPLFTDLWLLLRGRPLPVLSPSAYCYTKSHRIGFFIAMGATTYMLMGLSFCVWPDRSTWPWFQQLLSFLFVSATSSAGLGHLFSALEHNPRKWRLFVVAILCWYPVAMMGFRLVV